jgi:S1-C subfamily serine protease
MGEVSHFSTVLIRSSAPCRPCGENQCDSSEVDGEEVRRTRTQQIKYLIAVQVQLAAAPANEIGLILPVMTSIYRNSAMRNFPCPHCGSALIDDGSLAGKLASCSHCGRQLTMPSRLVSPQVPPPIARQSSVGDKRIVDQKSMPSLSARYIVVGAAVLVLVLLTSVGAFVIGRSNSGVRSEGLPSNTDARVAVPHPVVEPDAQAESPNSTASGKADANADSKTETIGDPASDVLTEPISQPEEAAKSRGSETTTPQQLFERVAPAVVQIEVKDRAGVSLGQGSGFFIDDSGTLITNAHVVLADNASLVVVRLVDESTHFVEEVQAVNREMDLAVLKVPAPLAAYTPLADSAPKVGMRVFAVGNPVGLRHTFSEGLVSGIRPYKGNHSIIQTTAPISPGSSGGPLLDEKGDVVGVTTMQHVIGQNLNFAMPASAVQELISKVGEAQKISSLTTGSTDDSAATGDVVKIIPVGMLETLAGIKGVEVVVEGLHADARFAGLRESTLQNMVELRLRRLGVPVITQRDRLSDPRAPYLYVNIATISDSERITYGFIVSVDVKQIVALVDPSDEMDFHTYASTWMTPTIYGSVGRNRLAETVRDTLSEMIDKFANEFITANQRR